MISYLETAKPYVGKHFAGIRISTRPDCIDEEVLGILKSYSVTAIELGAQSMCDDVLEANERGHTSEDTEKACLLIKKYGFSLGAQQAKLETAKSMILRNISIDIVAECTGLSPEEIEKL
jgi:predicted transposase/invertase (TIGR01784 family)